MKQVPDQILARLTDVAPAGVVKLDRRPEVRRRVEGLIAPEHPEEDEPDTKQVYCLTIAAACEHLGRVPARGPTEALVRKRAVLLNPGRQAKIEEMHNKLPTCLGEQKIMRLHVAMHDACCVYVLQAGENLCSAIPDLLLAIRLAELGERPQISVRSVRRDQQNRCLGFLHCHQVHYVSVRRHVRVDPDLVPRIAQLRVAGEIGLQKHLNCDLERRCFLDAQEYGARQTTVHLRVCEHETACNAACGKGIALWTSTLDHCSR